MSKKISSFIVLISLTGCMSLRPLENRSGYSILQGHTTSDSAQFSIVAPKQSILEYHVRESSSDHDDSKNSFFFSHLKVTRHQRAYSDWAVDFVWVRQLLPKKNYILEVRSPSGEILDAREFRLLPISNDKVRIAVVSCANDGVNKNQRQIWRELVDKSPDLLFFIGDNAYVTTVASSPQIGSTPEQIWQRYIETRLRLEIFRSSRLIPSYATWDDNDYGQRDGNQNYAYKKQSAEIFSSFFAQEPDDNFLKNGPGISHSLSAFGFQFLLLDNRTFRTPNVQKTGQNPQIGQNLETQTHWGLPQENWIVASLQSEKPTWIFNGDQIFGGYHPFESYEGNHPESFKKFFARMARIPTPVIFVTGDRHVTETMRIHLPENNFSTFEITTSPIHSQTYPARWDETPNPRQLDGKELEINYAIFDADSKKRQLDAKLVVYTVNNRALYRRQFEVRRGTGASRIYSH